MAHGARYRRWSLQLLRALVCVLLISTPASAQDSLTDLYEQGLTFLRQHSYQAAIENLRRVVDAEPAFTGSDGSAARQLALAMEADGRQGCQDVRIRGIEALLGMDVLDGRLVHDAVLALHADEPVPGPISGAYLSLLSRPDSDVWPLHAALTALLMSDEDRSRILPSRSRSSRTAADGDIPDFSPDAHSRLVTWWRSRDPVPASARNERLDEHLRRVAVAHREYSDTTRAVGLDDRGLLFLRLGRTQHVRHVSFDDARFYLDVVRFGVSMTPGDFPENEIWLYPHIDRAVYYVFARDHRRRFRTSTPTDLIPRRLQNATLPTERQMNMAVSALAALRHVYRALSLTHPDFGTLHGSIEDYAMWQEERRMARLAGGPLEIGEVEYRVGSGATSVPVYVNPMRSIAPPNEFVRTSVAESLLNDDRARRARERVEPDDHFDALGALGVDRLEASIRASRFRGPGGSTRVVIDWAPQPGALHLSRERLERLEMTGNERYTDILLRATVMNFDADGAEQVRVTDSVGVMTAVAPNGVMMPRSVVLDPAPHPGRIAMQIDRHAAVVRAGPPPMIIAGPLAQIAVWETSLNPLPAGFAMSDIRSHFAALTPVDVVLGPDELSSASPFPHDFAPSQGTLILEFETYGLVRDPEGQTSYAIEYEVARRESGGAFRRLLGRTRSDVTAARSEHRGEDADTRERIVLDPSEWADGADIRITIRVTDLNADRMVDRSLDFQS